MSFGAAPTVNKWGSVLLLAACTSVAVVLLIWTLAKFRAGRRCWDRLAAGSLRLAAVRNRVEDLDLLSHLPVRPQGRVRCRIAVAAAARPPPPPPALAPCSFTSCTPQVRQGM